MTSGQALTVAVFTHPPVVVTLVAWPVSVLDPRISLAMIIAVVPGVVVVWCGDELSTVMSFTVLLVVVAFSYVIFFLLCIQPCLDVVIDVPLPGVAITRPLVVVT